MNRETDNPYTKESYRELLRLYGKLAGELLEKDRKITDLTLENNDLLMKIAKSKKERVVVIDGVEYTIK